MQTGSGPSLQPGSLSNPGCELWLPCHLLPASNCLVSFLWRISTTGTFLSKVTNASKQQRTSVTEKRAGALRQGQTDATLDDVLMYVILSLWSSHISAAVGRCGSLALGSQTHHRIPALPQAQRFTFYSFFKSIPLPLILALKLSSLQQATTLASLLLSSIPSSRSETLPPPWALWTRHPPLSLPPGLPLCSGSSWRF